MSDERIEINCAVPGHWVDEVLGGVHDGGLPEDPRGGGVSAPVSLADELNDVIARVRRADGTEADPVEVWQLVVQFALLRMREAEAAEATP